MYTFSVESREQRIEPDSNFLVSSSLSSKKLRLSHVDGNLETGLGKLRREDCPSVLKMLTESPRCHLSSLLAKALEQKSQIVRQVEI